MLSIKLEFNTDELIKHLTDNADKHINDYNRAMIAYWAKLNKILNELTEDAQKEVDREDCYFLRIKKPIDKSAEYEKHINMFKSCTKDVVELTSEQYDAIVNDNWDWVQNAKLLNSSYL